MQSCVIFISSFFNLEDCLWITHYPWIVTHKIYCYSLTLSCSYRSVHRVHQRETQPNPCNTPQQTCSCFLKARTTSRQEQLRSQTTQTISSFSAELQLRVWSQRFPFLTLKAAHLYVQTAHPIHKTFWSEPWSAQTALIPVREQRIHAHPSVRTAHPIHLQLLIQI
jgi:hypothetical protein